MTILIKGSIGIGFSNCTHNFEFTSEQIGYSEEEWSELDAFQINEALNQAIEDELASCLDTWVDWEKV